MIDERKTGVEQSELERMIAARTKSTSRADEAEIEVAALEHDFAIVCHNARVARSYFCTISGMEFAHAAWRAGKLTAFERLTLMVAVGPAALRRVWRDFVEAREAEPVMVEQARTSPIGRLCDALQRAYADVSSATFVLRRAGVDLSQVRTEQSAAGLWKDALVLARDRGQIAAIVAVALEDQGVRAHHDKIRLASDADGRAEGHPR